MSLGSDSDSEPDSDRDEDNSGAAHIATTISQESGDNEGRFETPLPSDMVEVREGRDFVEVE